MRSSPNKYNYLRNLGEIRNVSAQKTTEDRPKNAMNNNPENTSPNYHSPYIFNPNMQIAALKTQNNEFSKQIQSKQVEKDSQQAKNSNFIQYKNGNMQSKSIQKYEKKETRQKSKLLNLSYYPIRAYQGRKEEEFFQKQYTQIKSWYKNKQMQLTGPTHTAYLQAAQNNNPSKLDQQFYLAKNEDPYIILKEFQKPAIKDPLNKSKKNFKTLSYHNNQPYLKQQNNQQKILANNKNNSNKKTVLLESKMNHGSKIQTQAIYPCQKPYSQEAKLKRDNQPYRLKNNQLASTQYQHLALFKGHLPSQSFRMNTISYDNGYKRDRVCLSPRKYQAYAPKYYL